jgi:hypothetical protein
MSKREQNPRYAAHNGLTLQGDFAWTVALSFARRLDKRVITLRSLPVAPRLPAAAFDEAVGTGCGRHSTWPPALPPSPRVLRPSTARRFGRRLRAWPACPCNPASGKQYSRRTWDQAPSAATCGCAARRRSAWNPTHRIGPQPRRRYCYCSATRVQLTRISHEPSSKKPPTLA